MRAAITFALICVMGAALTTKAVAATSTITYQVAFVPTDFALNIWSGPGSSFRVVDSLISGEQVGITGAGKSYGEETWIPISYHDGKTGWANRAYLLGTMDPNRFCADTRAKELIVSLKDAVQKHDGQKLATLVADQGLYLNLDEPKTLHLSLDEVRGFFTDQTPRNWGPDYGGGADRIETLATDITGLLEDDLLPKNVLSACNDSQDRTVDTDILSEIRIPGYNVVNFYSLFRPGKPGYELNWGAWGVGFTYWNEKPAILALSHYVWTP